MTEHSPTPWRINGHCSRPHADLPHGSRIVSDRGDGFEFHIAAVGRHPGITAGQARANAAFIVKAVNSHGPLVAALTDALCELSHCADQLGAREYNSVRRAIAEARRILAAVSEAGNGGSSHV